MTSDIGTTDVEIKSLREFRIAQGKARSSLTELHPGDLNTEMQRILYTLNLRDIRGFMQLRQLLPQRGDRTLIMGDGVILETSGFDAELIDTQYLLSYFVKIGRRVLSVETKYHHLESGRITFDWEIARKWSGPYILAWGKVSILLLWRPKTDWRGHNGLVICDYEYRKIPDREEYAITRIHLTLVDVREFSKYFGDKAPQVAVDLIREVATQYSRTLDILQHEMNRVKERSCPWESMASRICST